MTVQVGSAATSGEKEIERNYPVDEGLTAGTTKQEGTKARLEAEEGTFVPERKRVGLGYQRGR